MSSRRLELVAAVCLAIARLSMSFAVVCLCLASYAWWGGPRSPLGALWVVAAALTAPWLAFLLLHRRALSTLLERQEGHRVDLGFFDTLSTAGIRKLDAGDRDA